MTSSAPSDGTEKQGNDKLLKPKLGPISLAAMGFTTMMGSGWLLASHYAAQIAGPMAIVSWLIAGFATVLVGLTYSHLAVAWPLAGGNVRWPRLTAGPFVGAVVGWAAFVQISIATPGEATAILQYASQWAGGLFLDKRLTPLGIGIAVVLMLLCVALNFLGVVTLARFNNVLVTFKILVPVIIIVMFIASGYDSSNITAGGGWAPSGFGAVLTAVTSAGLLFSFAGVMTPAVMSGEAKNPRRDVPLATMLSVGAVLVIYIGLQVAYLVGIPTDMLAASGWSGINLNSPFAQIALFLNLNWLSILVLVDASVAPGGTLFTSTGWKGRVTFGMAQDRMLPKAIGRVHAKSGIPREALILNLVISITFLLIFQSWQQLASVAGYFLAIVYAGASIAAGTIDLHPDRPDKKPWFRYSRSLGAASYTISALLIFWAGWDKSRDGLLILTVLFVAYIVLTQSKNIRSVASEARDGLWFAVMITGVAAVSLFSSYKGGLGVLPEPYGSLIVIALALITYTWGVRRVASRFRAQGTAETAYASDSSESSATASS